MILEDIKAMKGNLQRGFKNDIRPVVRERKLKFLFKGCNP
jgi:hypothetical protein